MVARARSRSRTGSHPRIGSAARNGPRPAAGDRLSRLAAHDRRAQILDAAFDVFSEKGFHGARTRELALRAGVSEGLVFSHFPTKEALVRAIIDRVGFEDLIPVLEERLGRMPPRAALLALAERVLTNLRDRPHVFRVVFFGLLETPELAARFYRKFLSRLLALETRLFRRAFAERRGNHAKVAADPAVVARSFHGSLLFYNIAGAIVRLEPIPRNPKALAAEIVNLYLPGRER